MHRNDPSRSAFAHRPHLIESLFAIFLAILSAGTTLFADKPNVILIMTDDQGIGDLGVMGNPIIQTPHLDAFAKEAASIRNFYVSPVCSPTRASLMTGRYNYRTRVVDTWIGRSMMEPDEVTIAEILGAMGYSTGIFGKWHLGDNYPMRPQDQGFDVALVHRGGGIGQPADPVGGERQYTNPVLFQNGVRVEAKGYCTDVYFQEASNWIRQCVADAQPFFCYIATNAPHAPFHDVPAEWLDYYKQVNLANDQFPANDGHRLPADADLDRRARIFAMISNIDENVGRLLRTLKELKLEKDTIVIFMTDNGPNGRRYVAGMRGSKSSVYEGGIRSPFFVRWPERLAANRTVDAIGAHIDVLPTLLDACEVSQPMDLRLDGVSLLPYLEGTDQPLPARAIVIQSHRGDEPVLGHQFALRTSRWKLLNASGFSQSSIPDGEPNYELYDMFNDPLELHNVADEFPDVARQLWAEYETWFRDVGTTRPDNFAPPRIIIGTVHENPTTLTRQDWRHENGRMWAADSNGSWQISIASAGLYEIKCRLTEPPNNAMATVQIGDQVWHIELTGDVTTFAFPPIRLEPGEASIKVTMKNGDRSWGPHQVDIKWIDNTDPNRVETSDSDPRERP